MQIIVKMGDLTTENVDAIVNAANKYMCGGGGIDGAIHRAAGPELMTECMSFQGHKEEGEMGMTVRCPDGETRVTGGYRLPAKYIIHTVGPKCPTGEADIEKENILYDCWYNSLDEANRNGLKSIAFPSIATGAYMFPLDKAVKIAAEAISDHIYDGTSLEEIRIVCFHQEDYDKYDAAMKDMFN